MGMQTETSSTVLVVDMGPSQGSDLGDSASDLIGFYGTAPVAQITTATALTDSSGGTAASGTGIQALTSSYNSGLIVNGISTLAATLNKLMSDLRTIGILK